MLEIIRGIFDTTGFMPHGHCYLWTPWLVYANVITDTIIFGAYFAISIALVVLLTTVKEIPFHFIYAAFGVFIIACGFGHLMEVMAIWIPAYWALAIMKIVTAVASLGTAFLIPANFSKIRELARGASLLKAQEALKETEALYKQIVDTANEGIWLIDKNRITKFVNQRTADMLGYTRDEMIGLPISDFMGDEGRGIIKQLQSSFNPDVVENYSMPLRKKDGTSLWVNVSRSHLYDKNGERSGILGMLTDITKKRDDEEKLRLSEIRFRSLVEGLPQLIWTMRVDGTADYSNENLLKHLGFSSTEMLPQILQAIHPEDRSLTAGLWATAFADGQPVECEFRLRHSDDFYRWQLCRIIPIRNESGTIVKWMGIATDIHEQKEDQRVSRDAQTKLKAALLNMNSILWTVDKDFIVTTSEGRYPGYLSDENVLKVGQSMFTVEPGRPLRYQAVKDSFEGRSSSYQTEINGNTRETFIKPLRNDSGEITGAVAVSMDVTERITSERENFKNQERFRVLCEAVPQLIWTADKTGKSTFFNQRWHDYTGLDDNTSDSEYWKILHPDQLAAVMEHWQHSVTQELDYQAELKLLNRQGEYRWHLGRALPVRDNDGLVIQWFGTLTDIHDQKMAEEKSRELERNLMTILDFAPIILWAADREGRITFFQGKSLENLKYRTSELVGQSFADSNNNAELKQANHQRALAGESWTAVEHEAGLWFETHHSPMRNAEGEIIGQVAVSTDITQRREAEIAKERHESREASAHEALRLRSEFLAHMSHEIRTPLNGLLGMINLISEAPLRGEVREYAEHAKFSGEMLLSIIDNFLDFSKIEAGKVDIESINFNLHDLIYDAEKSIFYAARAKGIRVYADLAEDVPRYIQSDLGRIRQVLSNLLTNALKFTLEGAISLKVRRTQGADGSDLLLLEVIDTGIGISVDGINRIFEAFSQADSSTTRRFGGTGLGLSICKHLVEKMGGNIGVQSEVNKGSTFWFTVKLVAGSATAEVLSAQLEPIYRHEAKSFILVADDNAINRKVILKFLDSMGIKAQAVSNGIDVLKALNEEHYDLIFMDCQMPGMDGYECTNEIRRSKAPYSEIPIVALTASAMQRDYDRCLDVGMNSYILKPIKREALYSAIIEFLPSVRNQLTEK